jgi:hypothetical protein
MCWRGDVEIFKGANVEVAGEHMNGGWMKVIDIISKICSPIHTNNLSII